MTAARTPPCTKRHEPAPLFPPFPDKYATEATRWRALFLRDLAILRAGEKLWRECLARTPQSLFIYNALHTQEREIRTTFTYWLEEVGGLTGGGL